MASNWQKPNETTYSSDDLSSINVKLSNNLTAIELNEAQPDIHDFELRQQTLIEECASLKKQCNDLTTQKQAIEIRSDMLLAENRRIIEEKDNELKHLRETLNTVSSNHSSTNLLNNNQSYTNEFIKHEQVINELKDENLHLKKTLELHEQTEKEYDEQIHTLQLRIKELEDWNGDTIELKNTDHSNLQSNIDLLISRNSQLENDFQRLQLQQRNNQLAIERLDEYEETIAQLQEDLDQLRSNKKKQQTGNDEDTNRLLIEERKRYEVLSHLLEETRLQLKNELERSEEKISQIEINLKEKFEGEKTILQDQLQKKEKQIEIERNERENLQQLKNNQIEFEKELNIREILERQIIELNEEIQSLENDNHELQQQLQSRDRQIQTFQASAPTPGSPPTIISSSNTRNLSLSELETQLSENEGQFHQLNSIYNQFLILLPTEYSSSDNTHLSLSDRFIDLFEQFSTYIGTFSIIQEELESLKQILIEKQDELEKLRSHLELTTDKLTQFEEQQTLLNKTKPFDSDEDELEEILEFQQRAPSRQSLLSLTPGEKQQLISQNELLSSLLIEKEQEIILLQQAEKTREDLIKNFESLTISFQQIQLDKEVKQIEFNDIRNILDEKLRENSSLKKEKMYFIEKLAEFERERQEQQSIIQISTKQSSPDRQQSPSSSMKIKTFEENSEQILTENQYDKLRSDYEQLLELSARQHDESLSYYNEYTRILTLYNDLNTKYSQLQIDSESIQSLIQQKNEAYLQCQNELNTYQNLLYHQKKKSNDIDLLRSTLNEREIKLQQLITNEQELIAKQSELERNLKLLEENNFKLISNQELFEQIQLDLKRITHERDLAIVEKKQLENQMELNPQFDTLKYQYEKIEEFNIQLNNQIKYLQNNQQEYQESLNEQISITARLTDEIQTKDLLINNLQQEIDLKNKQIIEYDENVQLTNNSRVEKQLVKNILLSYFHTPIDKQQEVIPLIGALVGFTQEEYQKAMNAISNNYNNTTSSNWLTSWLGPNSVKTKTQSENIVYHPDKSFAELLIQYVDQQSVDNLEQPTDNSSVSTSDNPTQFTT